MSNKYNIPERLNKSINGLKGMVKYLAEKEDLSKMQLLEVGSWTGLSAVIFADNFHHVTCVDPWESTGGINTKYDMKKVHEIFLARTNLYKNIGWIKDRFDNVDLEDSYNIVYIDGLHTYEQVKKDIEKSLKMSNIKYITGHDYCNKFPGVKKAINEAFGKPDVVFSDSSWIVKLRKGK